MPSNLTCPDDVELLAIASGEPSSAELRAHLADCARCRERLERFQAEVGLLRREAPQAMLAASTANGIPSGPAADNGEPGASEETASCSPAGGVEGASPDATDSEGFGFGDGTPGGSPLLDGIDRYLVVGKFPVTGQAEVYRVVHRVLGKDMVLKLARRPIEPGGRSEIVEEGRILVNLKHPHLVQVYDLDFLGDRPYLVMEFIRGRTLDQLADEGRVKPRRAAALLAKVAGAAGYAHREGIVHRDIKPKNILVDEAGKPWLIDFGMARLRHAWSDDRVASGGTFAYMAPEQARIESPAEQEKVGPRSDVFALGAVLYYLLTGAAPFAGETWRASMDRARRCDFDRKALDGPKIPRDLRRICLKAMAADPADRYPSAEAFQRALRRYLAWPGALAVAGGVGGPVLLGLWLSLNSQFRARMPDSSRAMSPPPSAPVADSPSIPARAEPLKGRINLLVVKSKDGTRRRLRLDDPRAVPVKADDEVRIEARLDRPAYLYLFWIGSEGKVAPLYPWKKHDWSQRPAEERKVTGAELPEILDDVWEIPASPPGLETLVLLAREDTPLPRADEARLAEGLSGAPVPLPPDLKTAVWIEDGQEVTFEPTAGLKGHRSGEGAIPRSIPSPETRKTDDPVLRIRALLRKKVQPLGSYSQAVVFPNQGGSRAPGDVSP